MNRLTILIILFLYNNFVFCQKETILYEMNSDLLNEKLEIDSLTESLTIMFKGRQLVINSNSPKLRITKLAILNSTILNTIYIDSGTFPNLKELKISNTEIDKIPFFIYELNKLENLDLSCNKIFNIPDSLFGVFKLKKLNLTGNSNFSNSQIFVNLSDLEELYLNNCDIVNFPNIEKLPKLQILDLSSNYIKSISEDVFERTPSLSSLNLSFNLLEKIPKSIFYLNDLKFLDLRRNIITRLPDEITNLQKLMYLDLSSNKLKKINISFKKMNRLIHLGLGCNNLSNIKSSNFLSNHLKFIDFSYNNLSNDSKAQIIYMLKENYDLSIVIEGNNIINIPELVTMFPSRIKVNNISKFRCN